MVGKEAVFPSMEAIKAAFNSEMEEARRKAEAALRGWQPVIEALILPLDLKIDEVLSRQNIDPATSWREDTLAAKLGRSGITRREVKINRPFRGGREEITIRETRLEGEIDILTIEIHGLNRRGHPLLFQSFGFDAHPFEPLQEVIIYDEESDVETLPEIITVNTPKPPHVSFNIYGTRREYDSFLDKLGYSPKYLYNDPETGRSILRFAITQVERALKDGEAQISLQP